MQIEDIHAHIRERKIKWTTHVTERLQERGIYPSDIRVCLFAGEIIENYPEDYPYPSCLVLGLTQTNTPLHVVVSLGMGRLWIITAYVPSGDKWQDDWRTRQKGEL